MVYLVFGIILSILWQFSNAIEQNFIAVFGQIVNKYYCNLVTLYYAAKLSSWNAKQIVRENDAKVLLPNPKLEASLRLEPLRPINVAVMPAELYKCSLSTMTVLVWILPKQQVFL